MDAERALPSQCAFPRLRVKHKYQLGSQFRCGVDLLANDGIPDPNLDFCDLCYFMYRRLALHLAYISRDQGTESGGDGGVAHGRMGGEGKSEKS